MKCSVVSAVQWSALLFKKKPRPSCSCDVPWDMTWPVQFNVFFRRRRRNSGEMSACSRRSQPLSPWNERRTPTCRRYVLGVSHVNKVNVKLEQNFRMVSTIHTYVPIYPYPISEWRKNCSSWCMTGITTKP